MLKWKSSWTKLWARGALKSTVVTASMLSILLSLLALENKEKLGYLSVLVTQLRNEYSSWIRGVQKFKLATTKRDKLAVHKYSLNKRCHACMRYDKCMRWCMRWDVINTAMSLLPTCTSNSRSRYPSCSCSAYLPLINMNISFIIQIQWNNCTKT